MSEQLRACFPYFGGKTLAAELIWSRIGDCPGYIEPFAGSLGVLLGRPSDHVGGVETVNDFDGNVSNFWRSVRNDPDGLIDSLDWPVSEADLSARHYALVQGRSEMVARLEGDPEWCDAKRAGWWAWGLCCWIGSSFCSGDGPWIVEDGMLVDSRQLPNLSAGHGINRKLPHLGDAGRGINHKLPHLGDAGKGRCAERRDFIRTWIQSLQDRMREVRVCNGDWERICTPSIMKRFGVCGVVLDPPYIAASSSSEVYAHNGNEVAERVVRWCHENGDDPDLRIALYGYEGDYTMPANWTEEKWNARKGYQKEKRQETVWFSPACITPSKHNGEIFSLISLD